VELRYSPTCRTAWARVETTDPEALGFAIIHRISDGREAVCNPAAFPPLTGSFFGCFTTQLYDGGVTSFAEGFVQDEISGNAINLITGSF
jgi:hypothetical protein